MTGLPASPRLVKAGLVVLDPESGAIRRVVALQYNPDTLTRTLTPKAAGGETQDRAEPLRLKGPATETIRLEAELDATDALERGDGTAGALGLQAELALLESLASPTSEQLAAVDRLASSGALEIHPMLAPLTLLVWGRQRVTPVRLTELGITEEAFDPELNPIRAKVTLALRVLSVDDLGFASRGGGLFLAYLRSREQLATRARGGQRDLLGLGALP